jgi:hypothetical protein
MKPDRRAAGKITLNRRLGAEDAPLAHGAQLAPPGVIPRNETVDVGQLASGDARLDAADLALVHTDESGKMAAIGMALILRYQIKAWTSER